MSTHLRNVQQNFSSCLGKKFNNKLTFFPCTNFTVSVYKLRSMVNVRFI